MIEVQLIRVLTPCLLCLFMGYKVMAQTVPEIRFESEKELMSSNINSKYVDTRPVISPDGMTLYFARQNHPDNTRGKSDQQDIYFSEFKNGEFGLAQNIGHPLNKHRRHGVNTRISWTSIMDQNCEILEKS